jgi:hypothetical protein
MGRQLGWVWFGGKKYKITVFYLTENNDVFCREDSDDPVLLVSQLPKRVQLGFSGTFELGSGVSSLLLPRFGYDIVDGLENNNNIGNSLDDLLDVQPRAYLAQYQGGVAEDPYAGEPSRYRRSSVEMYANVISTDPEYPNIGVRVDCSFFLFPGTSSYNFYELLGINAQYPYDITGLKGVHISLDRTINGVSAIKFTVGAGFVNFSIPSISNAYGFMARLLPSKTIFAITDQAGFADFPAYRGRITTGTVSAFTTHELPTVPTLDPDMFIQNDEIPSNQKVPYSIVQAHRSINFYDNSNKTICLTQGDVIENTSVITNRLIGNSSVTIQVFDSAIHQNNSQAIPQQIPGLPSNTKAVLGVLACPV